MKRNATLGVETRAAGSCACSYQSRSRPIYLRPDCDGCRHGSPQQAGKGRVMPFTEEEVAARFGKKGKRWLQQWLRAHRADKHGEPYYTPVGRQKIFHERDIARIELALREGVQCHSRSDRRAKGARRITKSVGHTSESEWNAAAALTNDPSLCKRSSESKPLSRSTGNTPRPSPSLVQGSRHS